MVFFNDLDYFLFSFFFFKNINFSFKIINFFKCRLKLFPILLNLCFDKHPFHCVCIFRCLWNFYKVLMQVYSLQLDMLVHAYFCIFHLTCNIQSGYFCRFYPESPDLLLHLLDPPSVLHSVPTLPLRWMPLSSSTRHSRLGLALNVGVGVGGC